MRKLFYWKKCFKRKVLQISISIPYKETDNIAYFCKDNATTTTINISTATNFNTKYNMILMILILLSYIPNFPTTLSF